MAELRYDGKTQHGRNVRSIVNALAAFVNEMQTDHATFKATVDALETMVEELAADHATFKTAADQVETLIEELHDDHATFKTALDATETLVEETKADFNLLRSQFLNANFGYPLLAEGTNANTLKTTNATTYSVGGQNYTYAATDNIAMTAAAQQAISTFCLYLVSINAGGTVTTTKGTELGTDTAVLPPLPASSAPLGAFKVATDGATTFTSGTTDLGAAGLTVTYYTLAVANSGTSASTAVAASDPASGPATLTASKPASAPATLSASAAIPSAPATLTASTAIDTLGS